MKLRINTSGVSFTCSKAPEPRTDFGSGQPKIDKATGAVLHQVQMMALDADGGDVLSVTVAGEPKVTVGQSVAVTNLVATPGRRKAARESRSAPTPSPPLTVLPRLAAASPAPNRGVRPGHYRHQLCAGRGDPRPTQTFSEGVNHRVEYVK